MCTYQIKTAQPHCLSVASYCQYYWVVASAARYYLISDLGERVVADLRKTLYQRLLAMTPTFYTTMSTGDVLARLTNDTTVVQTVVGSTLSVAVRTLVTTAGALLLMFIVSWKLSIMVLLLTPVVLVPVILLGRRVQQLSRNSQDRLGDASARASESLRGLKTIQLFNREER